MVLRRTRDLGSIRYANPEMLVAFAIMGFLIAVALLYGVKVLESKGPRCIEHLVHQLDQPLPGGTVCPKSGKRYTITAGGDLERIACPAEEVHLESNPHFVRPKGGAWRLQQILTPYAGGPLEFDAGRTEVHQSPGRLSLHLLPARSYRYLIGPAVFAVMVGISLLFPWHLFLSITGKQQGGQVSSILFATLFAFLGYWVLKPIASSSEIVLERGGSHVHHIEYEFGSKVSEKAYAESLGFIPSAGIYPHPSKLLLVHKAETGGNRLTEFEGIPRGRLDLVQRFNEVLVGP